MRAACSFDDQPHRTSNSSCCPQGATLQVEIDVTHVDGDPGFDPTAADSTCLPFSRGSLEIDHVVLR